MLPESRTPDEGFALPRFALTPRDVEGFLDELQTFHDHFRACFSHIPSDLVVDHCPSAVESSSPLDSQGLHDIWTTFDRRISCQINSTISTP